MYKRRKDTKPERIRQGQIYYVDLQSSDGAQQTGRRPLLIISANEYNEQCPAVIMIAITSQIKMANMKTHIVLPPYKGLPKKSMAIGEQHFTIAKTRLEEYCCKLHWWTWIKVHKAVRASEKTWREDYEKYDGEEFVAYDGGSQ